MTEEEMKKRLYQTLEQEDLSQLKFPFIGWKKEPDNPSFSCLKSDVKTDSRPSSQQDFLTHKVYFKKN